MSKKYQNFFWFTVVPFLIPFISELKDEWMTSWLKWGIIILAMGVDFYFSFKMLKSEENEQKEYFLQKSIRYAYSCAHELMENKRDMLSHDLEFHKINLQENILPYDIHLRLIEICRQFKNVISSITQINSEYVSCTLIYKYSHKEGEDWKWAAGRDPIRALDLNQFVKEKDTSYYQIIENKTNFVYVAKKDAQISGDSNCYHLGNRDKMYNNVGSAFSIKIAFGDNRSPLVEGILTVTTFGKYFTQKMDMENKDEIFKRIIVDEIFPYYKKMLELEFGMMYLRHMIKDGKKI